MRTSPRHLLVSDFDGTMTKHDFFDLARRDLPSAADHDHWADYVAGRITHFEALARIFGAIRTDWAGIEGVLERMQTRAELYEVLGYHDYERKLDALFGNDAD